MKLLIFGASGKTGHELVRQSLDQGHTVTAFVRHPTKLSIRHDQLTVVQGDVIHYPMVDQAVQGHDIVLSALGANHPFKYDHVVIKGFGNIIRAMELHDRKRLIYLSAFGVKESRDHAGFMIRYIAPKILSTELGGHEAREQMLKTSELPWTIVRAGLLTNGEHKSKYRFGENIHYNGFLATISRADVADFMLRQIHDEAFIRKMPRVMY